MLKVMVKVDNLMKGMYIAELDRPWLESPFIFQGFRITNQEEISQLKGTCKFVYVDQEKSSIVIPQQAASRQSMQVAETVRSVKFGNSPLSYQLSFEEELPQAWEIYKDTLECIDNLFRDIRTGESVNGEQIKATVNRLVNSVIRHPDALMLLCAIKEKSNFALTHAINVCVFSLLFARYLGMEETELKEIGTGALLHDVGETLIPTEILLKQGERTPAENKVIMSHTKHGVDILSKAKDLPKSAINIARDHHERADGSGFPSHIMNDQIDNYTKIVAIVDIYDTVTSGLYGKPAVTSALALKNLYNWRQHLFDTNLVEKFIQCLGIYPVGSVVEFRSGEVGIVISVEPTMRLTPKILLVRDADKQHLQPPKLINLALFHAQGDTETYKISLIVEPERYDIDIRNYILRDLNIRLA